MDRRRWLVFLPVVFITYSLAYLDRANYSFGAAAGMAADLHITGATSSLLGALFFLGYFMFQIPGVRYAEKNSIKKVIFVGLIAWGALAAITGLVSNIALLAAVRFSLGVVESAVFPALLILLARWFTRKERARVNSFLILGNALTMAWMSMASGYLVQWFGWRMMFVIEGIPPIIWAFVWWRLVSDRPAEAVWLADGEKTALAARLAEEQRGIAPIKDFRAAMRSPVVLALCLQFFCWSLGLYGFVIWLPSMLKIGGSAMGALGLLSSVPYVAAVILMTIVSAVSDRLLRRKLMIWPCLLLGALAFYASYAIGQSNFWLGYWLLVAAGGAMYASYGPFFAYISETLPSNVAGGALALINSMGALGAFAGSYAVGFLNDLTGNSGISYLVMAGALALASAIAAGLPEAGLAETRPAAR